MAGLALILTGLAALAGWVWWLIDTTPRADR